MPTPLPSNEQYQILCRLRDHIQSRLDLLTREHQDAIYRPTSPESLMFVRDCVSDAIYEIDRVLSPVPSGDEMGR